MFKKPQIDTCETPESTFNPDERIWDMHRKKNREQWTISRYTPSENISILGDGDCFVMACCCSLYHCLDRSV